MSNNKKIWKVILIFVLLLFLLASGFSAYYIYSVFQAEKEYRELQEKLEAENAPTLEEVMQQDFTARDGDSPVIPSELYVEEPEEKTEIDLGIDVTNPIDFNELAQINTDLYAWIRIPDTNIDYPIAQHPEQDDFYLNHNMYKKAQFSGSIYSESANEKDFSDPVTVLYGHNMKNGSMFQNLHCFENKEFFDEHPYIYIYTPEGTMVYQVVYAGVTDDKHILYTYNYLEEAKDFETYLEEMFKPSGMGTFVRDEVEVDTDSRILVMSTCTNGKADTRYIVQAVRVYDDREEE